MLLTNKFITNGSKLQVWTSIKFIRAPDHQMVGAGFRLKLHFLKNTALTGRKYGL
jgi:hypothetical protein